MATKVYRYKFTGPMPESFAGDATPADPSVVIIQDWTFDSDVTP